MKNISKETVDKVVKLLTTKYGEKVSERASRSVSQVASFWTIKDGDDKLFTDFCTKNFIGNDADRLKILNKLSDKFEILGGYFNRISVDLKRPLHLDTGELLPIDDMFGEYEPSSHMADDFFNNKIAFYTILNFPFCTLKEKSELGPKWSRQEWAFARAGDKFTDRIPANLNLKEGELLTKADSYISEYNICMGNLVDNKGKTYFPKDMKLISHWGLRDELKSDYIGENGLTKQKMIYDVMKHIIQQDIPQTVINNDKVTWAPESNKVFEGNKQIEAKPEPDTRYQIFLDNFKIMKQIDEYCPMYPDFIQRSFDQGMEMSQPEVEKLFNDFCSSPQVKEVAALIKKRLGRNLEAFDIWYDGFKSRSSIPQEQLDKICKEKYPTNDAFHTAMPDMLCKLGFTKEKAEYIASRIVVEAARGSGHAWGAEMKSDKSLLRTRIKKDGFDYKGYNIAVHEFGHNVEQTITLQDIDYYMLKGVPNTAFTEAMAFLFQKRDLELLGIKDQNADKTYLASLDDFWSCYEIMGVAMLDMNVWKWLYAHPEANASQLKEAVIQLAKETWNKYYADVFGMKDQPILAIYSHMIEDPLYLSNYPIGHLVEFQVDQYVSGKNFGEEIHRMLVNGSIIPQIWMMKAVGNKVSINPLLIATEEAVKHLNK
ncbi:MAG: hypothetical protein NTW49_01590 [Bacteroidia bacterium]|nr:hypothetical protein [Bacteroidia bacterium]